MSERRKAISCVAGAVLINLTLGTFYSIGNVVPYMASYMRNNGNPDVTSAHASWITAAFLLGQGIFIIVGSYIEQNYDNRVACIFGCSLHCLSSFGTIWAIKWNFLAVVLIYGFGSGLGCGSAYMASIIAAQKWFPNHKGVFTGIIVAGFGFGGLIFTNLQTLYLNPDNVSRDATGYFTKQVYDRVPNMFMYMSIIFLVAQSVGCAMAFPPPKSPVASSQSGRSQGTTIINEDPLPTIRTLCSSFSHRIFYIIGLMMMLVAPGVTFVNSLGKSYGQAYLSDDRFLATVVALAAVANALGRLTWGTMTDRFSFGTCFSVKVALFATLIGLFPFGFILSSKLLYSVWMLGLFFGFSGTFVLFPIFIEQVFGVKYHGIIYGILYIFLAISSIVTSFIIQATVGKKLDEKGDPNDKLLVRLGPCAIIAIAYIISLALYFLALPVRRLENAIRHRKEMDVAQAKNTLFTRQDLHPIEPRSLATEPRLGDSGSLKANSLGSIVRFGNVKPQTPSEIKMAKLHS